ncbi:MAG TPA: DUF1801 domain-containing protein [Bacteroidia bacterium]|jgi:uncharacterized protein YdhG (YjbR/CyaY superfamily)|nr:DUF1801 domain-containing protein [Bacteroidia bacterium]
MKKPKSVDEYISGFPEETRELLEKVRAAIQDVAPEAEEVISYMMPGYKLNGSLVWFAGFKNHIGFYPRGSSAIIAFEKELAGYKTSKGAVQFPMDKPMPIALIKKMVKYRVKENIQEAKK